MISLDNLTVSYGGWTLFDNISFLINPKDRIGLVGRNGAGKTTLLRIITGEQQPTSGSVTLNGDCTIGYLPQTMRVADTTTLVEETAKAFEEVLRLEAEIEHLTREIAERTDYESDGYAQLLHRLNDAQDHYHILGGETRDADIEKTLLGLGFKREDFGRPTSEFSGGWRMRIELAKLLLRRPSIFLLDEPTNHLDLDAIAWLEEFLINFENTVIVVSHDRYFLNKVCTQIADIDYGKIQLYAGNYDFWYEYTQLAQRQLREQNKKAEAKKKELQEFIARFSANASKSKQATSRKKLLESLDSESRPVSSRRYPFVAFKPDREVGNDLLTVTDLTKTVGDRKVLDHVSFTIRPNEKVAFVGSDTVAKTTLFQILAGELEPDEGSYKWGVTTSLAYFPSDNSAFFDGCELTLIDWLRQFSREQLETDIRGWLGRMLFAGEEATKKAKVLSGGERVRCMLCKMMVSGANVLILDEPTNHLDLESITALNNGLISFPGTLLFTSHDHQFVQTIADRIIEILPDRVIDRKETYDEYLASLAEEDLKKLR